MDTKSGAPRRDPLCGREHIRAANFNRWWLLPFTILTASALTAVSIIVFRPSFIDHGYALEEFQQTASTNTSIDCSGPSASDFSCYQKRYQDLVYNSGVQAAFADLKDQFNKEHFVQANCHQLTHVIGRAAADLYAGDLASTYSQGDNFCASGYYHGAMETIVRNIGADKIVDEANDICAAARQEQNQSLNHRNCAHGIGHGLMGLYQNELFESLEGCDALSDGWERDQCSGGVFMENIIDENNPSNPSKYLKADQPFYPCTEVKSEYKQQCYTRHSEYALKKQDNDFAKAFELCGKIEDGFQKVCYVGLGNEAADQGTHYDSADGSQAKFIRGLCTQAQNDEALSTCLIGAATQLIFYYDSDEQAKALCKSLWSGGWRSTCRQLSKEYMAQRQRGDSGWAR